MFGALMERLDRLEKKCGDQNQLLGCVTREVEKNKKYYQNRMILFATVAKSFFFSSNIRQFFREVEVLIDAVPQVEEEMQESVSAARGSAKQDSERIKARLDLYHF